MGNRTKIGIFDDEQRLGKRHRARILQADLPEEEFDVTLLSLDEFTEALQHIRERRERFREEGGWEHDGENPLDDVSILIVDYDLFEAQPYLNAEQIAYLARCFTTCGIVVDLNRFGFRRFDLTLKDHLESFADLHVGQEHLDNPFLWGDERGGDFAPWYWPALPAYALEYEQRVTDVKEAIREDRTIWETLGFPEEVHRSLPTQLVQVLGEQADEARFDRFVMESDWGLQPRDREHALDESGSPVDLETIARIAAARIGKWLEWWILPEQAYLVDAPHLVERFPSLIEGDREDIEVWNGVARRHTKEIPVLRTDSLEPFRLKASHWLSRPAWFWPQVFRCEDLNDVREPWNIRPPRWKFCEDTSRFHPEDEVVSFKAMTISPFGYRYVKRVEDVEYRPPERFAL